MVDDTEISDDSGDGSYEDKRSRTKLKKRRKTNNGRAVAAESTKLETDLPFVSLQPLLDLVDGDDDRNTFEHLVNPLLPEFIQQRKLLQANQVETDAYGQPVRPMTRYESSNLIQETKALFPDGKLSVPQAITLRKLLIQRERGLANISNPELTTPHPQSTPLTPLPPPKSSTAPNPVILDALYAIKTTPYNNSFASRLYGSYGVRDDKAMAIDWVTRSPWMELMGDVRDHYSLAHPERELPAERDAPITYTSLQARHLLQVHDILARSFWAGIDVSDSLDYTPEKATVVATYKHLVVGVAILSSPMETYITYLAVRAGWDNSQIATSMLYHLIRLNPNKDITLHVSVNNPAMLLYNRFGFKAEEFVQGFYEDYLDRQSRASKNAFRLRLRR